MVDQETTKATKPGHERGAITSYLDRYVGRTSRLERGWVAPRGTPRKSPAIVKELLTTMITLIWPYLFGGGVALGVGWAP